MFSDIEKKLLNNWQRDFPLESSPFATIARDLGVSEDDVLTTFDGLLARRAISRIGAVVRPNVIGASTLAAMAVPPERLENVAGHISSFREINHNYERDHHFNLWFVVTADCEAGRDRVLAAIERATGLAVMSLPLAEAYHIDLGFDLERKPRHQSSAHLSSVQGPSKPTVNVSDMDRALLWKLEAGLPVISRPYSGIAESLGLSEENVFEALGRLTEEGVVRRFGVIVRHHEVGYRANAMVVWDIPDDAVSDTGSRLARHHAVTLCYQRPRRLPEWPYNLFTMIHGTCRDQVLDQIKALQDAEGLTDMPYDILFSERRFKQKGASYKPGDDTPDDGSSDDAIPDKREVA